MLDERARGERGRRGLLRAGSVRRRGRTGPADTRSCRARTSPATRRCRRAHPAGREPERPPVRPSHVGTEHAAPERVGAAAGLPEDATSVEQCPAPPARGSRRPPARPGMPRRLAGPPTERYSPIHGATQPHRDALRALRKIAPVRNRWRVPPRTVPVGSVGRPGRHIHESYRSRIAPVTFRSSLIQIRPSHAPIAHRSSEPVIAAEPPVPRTDAVMMRPPSARRTRRNPVTVPMDPV